MKHYKSTVYYYWVHGSPPLHTFKLLFLEVRWSDRNNQIRVSSSEIVCVSSFFLSLSFFSFSFQDFWEKLTRKEGDPLPRFHLLRVFFQRLWHSLPAFRCCWTAQFPHAVSQAFLKADSLCRNLLGKKKIKSWCRGRLLANPGLQLALSRGRSQPPNPGHPSNLIKISSTTQGTVGLCWPHLPRFSGAASKNISMFCYLKHKWRRWLVTTVQV